MCEWRVCVCEWRLCVWVACVCVWLSLCDVHLCVVFHMSNEEIHVCMWSCVSICVHVCSDAVYAGHEAHKSCTSVSLSLCLFSLVFFPFGFLSFSVMSTTVGTGSSNIPVKKWKCSRLLDQGFKHAPSLFLSLSLSLWFFFFFSLSLYIYILAGYEAQKSCTPVRSSLSLSLCARAWAGYEVHKSCTPVSHTLLHAHTPTPLFLSVSLYKAVHRSVTLFYIDILLFSALLLVLSFVSYLPFSHSRSLFSFAICLALILSCVSPIIPMKPRLFYHVLSLVLEVLST